MTDQADAIAAFERLGLTSYEAKVLVALYRLGTGTARDVADVADVPRSQVYSVADSLEERDLLEVAESTPKRYRPVPVAEARATLAERLEREQERAFDYVEQVEAEAASEEEQEAVWTIQGADRIDSRVAELLSGAEERIVFGAPTTALVPGETRAVLEEQGTRGLPVVGISDDPDVLEIFEELRGVTVLEPPAEQQARERSGRFLVVDDDTILLSVREDDETAIWSANSMFASVLIQLIEDAPMPLGG